MKIWHQSFTVLEDVPVYADAMRAHARKVVRPDTEVVMHGLIPGTYSSDYPGSDIAYSSLYVTHGLQWVIQALRAEREKFDAYAMCTMPNPLLREIRSVVDLPVVGFGEASFHMACMLGRRFGLLCFIDQMIPLFEEQIEQYGLRGRCAGIRGSGIAFREVLDGFAEPAKVIERFQEAARTFIKEQGVDVIVPSGMPLNVLLATNGVNNVDGVPLIDGLAVTLKLAECFADLRRSVGMMQTRHGFFGAKPQPGRVEQVLSFYGADKLLGFDG